MLLKQETFLSEKFLCEYFIHYQIKETHRVVTQAEGTPENDSAYDGADIDLNYLFHCI